MEDEIKVPSDTDSQQVEDRVEDSAVEDSTEEPDEPTEHTAATSQPAEPTKAKRRIQWARVFAFGVLPAVALVLALGAGYLKWMDNSVRDDAKARSESMQAAKDSTIALLSYKPETVEQQLGAARDLLTGDFRDSYTSLTTDVVIPGAKQKHVSAVATVPAVASVSADPRHAVAGLIVAAYHSASHAPFSSDAYPTEAHRAAIQGMTAAELLAEAEEAIRQNDQGRASAAIDVYGEQGNSPDAVFSAMLKYTISEDGRLHGEKYFHTVREEFTSVRPAFRWRQLVGLARVTASAYGYNRDDQHGFRAAGYEEACKLLGVEV